ncbi:MAG: response regulator [Bacteroidales bacterium]|nr:response regulator [Bacteroidales bacterium]
MKSSRLKHILLLLALGVTQAWALPTVTRRSELPNSHVFSVSQDTLGYIWVATGKGIARVDGPDGYEVFFADPEDTTTIPSNLVLGVWHDSHDNLWVSTIGGVSMKRPRSMVFERFTFPNKELSGNFCTAFFELGDQIFAIGPRGLYEVDFKGRRLRQQFTIPSDHFNSAAPDHLGRIWLSNGRELFCLDRAFHVLTRIELPSGLRVLSMAMVDTVVAVGTSTGLRWLDPATMELRPQSPQLRGIEVNSVNNLGGGQMLLSTNNRGMLLLQHPQDTLSYMWKNVDLRLIPTGETTASLVDRSGNLWAGTFDKGLYRFGHHASAFNANKTLESTFRKRFVTRVTQSAKNPDILWVGTRHDGLIAYDLTADRIVARYTATTTPWLAPYTNDFVQEIHVDSDGRLWIGYGDALIVCSIAGDGHTLSPLKTFDAAGDIVCAANDPLGRVWVGLSARGLFIFNRDLSRAAHLLSDLKDHNNITRIIPFGPRQMLISSFSDNLYTIDLQTLVPIAYQPKYRRYWRNTVDMLRDTQGYLWLGTYNDGLLRYDPASDRLYHFPALKGTDVVGLAEDHDHNLWASTSYGLYRIGSDRRTLSAFWRTDGLGGNQYHEKCVYRSPISGTLFFGGNEGIEQVRPDNISPVHASEIPIYLSRFTAAGCNPERPAPYDTINAAYLEKVTLPHKRNSVTLEFNGINPDPVGHLEYAYCLKGLDKGYIESGTHTKATYSNLPAGHYDFMVKARPSGGEWGPARQILCLSVSPSPWLHPMALIGYIVVILCIILLFNRLYLRYRLIQQENAMAEERIAQERRSTANKTSFFTNISHELRTPLTLIYGPTKTLKAAHRNMTPDQIDQSLSFIDGNIDRMLTLTNQLLNFHKMSDADTLPLKVAYHDLSSQILGLITIYKMLAAEKGIQVTLDCPYESLRLLYDSDKVEKIVSNLIVNAIKYTPQNGHILIRVGLTLAPGSASAASNWKYVRIDVIDDGIGIKKQSLSRLFKRFSRLVKRDSSVQGYGIGLHYVSHLVSMHKGTITPSRNPIKGMTFTVEIPVSEDAYATDERYMDADKAIFGSTPPAEVATSVPSSEDSTQSSTPSERPKVLIVEDNKDMNDFLVKILEQDYDVVTAFDGVEGMHRATEEVPDIVVSDVMMPGELDGFALCDRLKSSHTTSHIPILLLTAKTLDEDKIKGYDAGAEGYLCKPFNPQVLLSRVKNLLDARRRSQRALVAKAGSTSAVDAVEDVEAEPEVHLTALDKRFIEKLYAYIDEHISDTELNVNSLGRELGFSRTNFYRKVKMLLGETPNDLLRIYRLNRAASLLMTREYTVGEVSDMTGFGNQSHFSALFKKHFGVSPRNYNGEQSTNQNKNEKENLISSSDT